MGVARVTEISSTSTASFEDAIKTGLDRANQTLRNDALAAVQRCKEIDPTFQPDPRAFSPRFVAFFQSAGSSGTQAAVPSSQ